MPLKNFIVTETLKVNNHMALGTTYKIEDSNNFNHQELVALLVNKNLKIQIGENFLNTSVTGIDSYLSNNDHSLVNVFYGHNSSFQHRNTYWK